MIIKGKNILVFSMLSTRDKETGLYNLMQDGNINSMLNKLFINLNNFDRCLVTIPNKELLNLSQLRDLKNILLDKFEDKVSLFHIDAYSRNVGLTRESMMHVKPLYHKINKVLPIDLVISEFPIQFGFKVNVVYTYNWNKVSDDDTSLSAKYFDKELKLSKYYKTYLFSKIQYEYMCSKTEDTENIIQHEKIYSPEFIKYQSEIEIKKLSKETILKIDELLKSQVLFYPLRVDDPRYEYDKCVEYAREHNLKFITTNHTNVDTKYKDVVDIQSLFPSEMNRSIYYYILSKLKPNDVILRYEYDMHVSLIEQLILSTSTIITPNINFNEIKKYIYD